MDSGESVQRVVASLGEWYKQAEIVLASDNCDSVNELRDNVNSAYNQFNSLCSNLSIGDCDVIIGTSLTRHNVDERYWNFKLEINKWFERFHFQQDTAQFVSLPEVSSLAKESRMTSSSEPQSSKTLPVQESKTSELSTMPSASEPRSGLPNTSLGSASLRSVYGLGDPFLSKPSGHSISSKSSKRSQLSRLSKTSSTASAKLESARIKLKLVHLEKSQMEEKLREEEEMERMRRQQIKAEYDRRIKRAELETSLYQTQRDTEDELSTSDSDDAVLPRKGESVLSLPRPVTSAQSTKPNLSLASSAVTSPDSNQVLAGHITSVTFTQTRPAGTEVRPSIGFSTAAAKAHQFTRQNSTAGPSSYYGPTYTSPAELGTSVRFDTMQTRQFSQPENVVGSSSHVPGHAHYGPMYTSPADIGTSVGFNAAQVYQPAPRGGLNYTARPTFHSQSPNEPPFFTGQQLYGDPWRGYYSDPLIPKPNVKKFEGDPLDYWAFYNRFRCHIADWLPSKTKMSYLLQHCSIEVSNNIQHFADIHDGQCAYDLAWEELRRRYGQPYVIAQACEEKLLAFPKMERDVANGLNKLSVLMKRCRYALADDRLATSLDSVPFLTSIASKFPADLKRKWVNNTVGISSRCDRLATFKDLALFVEEQATISNSVFGLKLFAQSSTKTEQSKNLAKSDQSRGIAKSDQSKRTKATSAFNALTSIETKPAVSRKCLHCAKSHYIYHCTQFRSLAYAKKRDVVKKHSLCWVCLNPGHFAATCTSGLLCKKQRCGSSSHNTILHPPEYTEKPSQSDSRVGAESNSIKVGSPPDSATTKSLATSCTAAARTHRKNGAYLDIVPLKVCSGNMIIHTYALLDSGSDRTFCERRLATELGVDLLKTPVKLAVQTLFDKGPNRLEGALVAFNVSSLDDSFNMSMTEVVVVEDIPVVPSVVPEVQSLQMYPHLDGVSLPKVEKGSVTLLIGNDFVEAHRCLESRFSPDPQQSPGAVLTPFGWMLRGTRLNHPLTEATPASSFIVRGLMWPSDVRDLHDLILTDEGEMFSPTGDASLYDNEGFMKLLRDHHEMLEFGLRYSMEDPIAYDMMVRNLKYEDGHYQLPLLWRNDADVLPRSQDMALQRLKGLKRRLQKNSDLKANYCDQMKAVLDSGYAEPVPVAEINAKHKTWYIPHHPVLNPKKPGKVRIVYDCAATVGTKCLNDYLMKGPDLTNSLVAVLLRFRKWLVPIISDVEAMFHQVRISPPDKDALRFYWWPDGNINDEPAIYRMAVHLFGAKSSPSIATFCLRETARQFGKHFDPHVSEIVLKSFYVDDCLCGANCEEAAISLIRNLRDLMAMGRFKLTKWLSSSDKVMSTIPEDEKSKAAKSEMPSMTPQSRVLGIS